MSFIYSYTQSTFLFRVNKYNNCRDSIDSLNAFFFIGILINKFILIIVLQLIDNIVINETIQNCRHLPVLPALLLRHRTLHN